MRAALVIALCASGCFSDRGIAIEVNVGDTSATSVTLHVGTTACDPANTPISCFGGIAPPNAAAHLPGKVWYRADPLPYTATVTSGKATFHLQVDADTTLPIVIAIGSSGFGTRPAGTATLHDIVVPASTARVVTTTLLAAGPIDPALTGLPSADQAKEWPATDAVTHACVAVERPTGGDFIVSSEDPDCDGLPPPAECDPAAYLGKLGAGLSQPDCFANSPTSGGGCVLGSRGCSEVATPSDGTCRPQVDPQERSCVPHGFCGSCNGSLRTCAEMAVRDPMVERIECRILAMPAGPGLVSPCPNHTGPIDLSSHFASGKCNQPQLASLDLAPFAKRHTFSGATLELKSPGPACLFDIDWSDGTHPGAVAEDTIEYGAIRVENAHGSVVVPLALTFVGVLTCGPLSIVCSSPAKPDDSLWSCVQ